MLAVDNFVAQGSPNYKIASQTKIDSTKKLEKTRSAGCYSALPTPVFKRLESMTLSPAETLLHSLFNSGCQTHVGSSKLC